MATSTLHASPSLSPHPIPTITVQKRIPTTTTPPSSPTTATPARGGRRPTAGVVRARRRESRPDLGVQGMEVRPGTALPDLEYRVLFVCVAPSLHDYQWQAAAGRRETARFISPLAMEDTVARFVGSTLQVMGALTENSVGQWSIVGGTGEFTLAQGIIKYKMDPASNKDDAIRELNIRIVYDADSVQVPRYGALRLPQN